jgi:archaemetzincin
MKHILIILTIITLFSCNNQPENIYSVDDSKTQTIANPVQTDKRIHIRGLGEFSEQDLQEISNYIEGFYKFDCVVESSVPSTKKMYMNNTDTLDVDNCIYELKRPNIKTIYVTSEKLVLKRQKIRGGTKLRGNTVIISSGEHNRETVIHELGHTLGLRHCDNLTCVMAIRNDEFDTEDFCNKCKKLLKENENIQ